MKPGTLVITNEECLVFVEAPPENLQLTLFNMHTKKIKKGRVGFIVKELESESGGDLSEWVSVSISGSQPLEVLKKSLITLDDFLSENTTRRDT